MIDTHSKNCWKSKNQLLMSTNAYQRDKHPRTKQSEHVICRAGNNRARAIRCGLLPAGINLFPHRYPSPATQVTSMPSQLESGAGKLHEFKPVPASWLRRDVLLFANSIGCSSSDLHFLYVRNSNGTDVIAHAEQRATGTSCSVRGISNISHSVDV